MRVLLLQLPIQTHDFFFSNENVPLASAGLRGIASELGVEALLLPRHLMNYGSDRAILNYILEVKPDLVGMSCYLWNVERSLFLAGKIKAHLSECRVVFGGPEVTPENLFLLNHCFFDIGVVGEGEGTWRSLLQCFPGVPEIPGLLLRDGKENWRFTGYANHSMRLSQWPSPFLQGALDAHLQGVLWIETVRGCVYHCAYCHYHKQTPRIRTFPLDRVLREVRRAKERGVREIVFLDPCFVKRPGLEKLIDGLSEVNHDGGIRFHAESTVEGIDAALAEKLGRSGFFEIEVGLQSIHPQTLRKIHRRFHPGRFLEGVRLLQEHGIEAMVDLIAGLPGDTLSHILRSLDWVIEREAYDSLMLYPLSLIPSTELHQRAGEMGLVSMPYPPYLLTRSPEIDAQGMIQSFQYYETEMKEDVSPLEMPLCIHSNAGQERSLDGLIHTLVWHDSEQVPFLKRIEGQAAYSFCLSMSEEVVKRPELWKEVFRNYMDENPFSLFSVEVPPGIGLEDLEPLWEITRRHHHPGDQDYTVTHTRFRSFFIFSRYRGITWKWPDPREFLPFRLPDGQKLYREPVCLVHSEDGIIPDWFLGYLADRYTPIPQIRHWEAPEEEEPGR